MRFVEKGYSGEHGKCYQETFLPTASLTSVRILMKLAIKHNIFPQQIDVKATYLSTPIDCEVYVQQSEGYSIARKKNQTCMAIKERLIWT